MDMALSSHRECIRKLYLEDNKTLEAVMDEMRRLYGVTASKNQYERKLKEWGFRKNLTTSEWQWAYSRLEKRKAEGKNDFVLTFNGIEVSKKRVCKEVNRNKPWNIQESQEAANAPTPEGLSISSPLLLEPPPSPVHESLQTSSLSDSTPSNSQLSLNPLDLDASLTRQETSEHIPAAFLIQTVSKDPIDPLLPLSNPKGESPPISETQDLDESMDDYHHSAVHNSPTLLESNEEFYLFEPGSPLLSRHDLGTSAPNSETLSLYSGLTRDPRTEGSIITDWMDQNGLTIDQWSTYFREENIMGEFNHALCTAADRDHTAVVEWLLGTGADVNAQVAPYGTSLQAVSMSLPSVGSRSARSRDSGVGIQIQWGLTNREECGKRTRTAAERELFQINRKYTPCAPCNRAKRRCDRTCAGYIACLRAKTLVFINRLEVARLFRSRPNFGHLLDPEYKSICELTYISPITEPATEIRLTQGLGNTLTTHVCTLKDNLNFNTSILYHTSLGTREIKMPRLRLANIESTRKSVELYIWSTWCTTLGNITRESAEIVRDILFAAQRHAMANPNSIVHRALQLLAVNRIEEQNWSICIQDGIRLGLSVVDDPECMWFGGIPITPLVDTQLHHIILKYFCVPLAVNLLRELRPRMELARKENWFETFLVTFILCTNMEFLLRHSSRNARRSGAKHRYDSIELVREYVHSMNIILARFNHLHNKTSPLRFNYTGNDLRNLYGLQEHEAELLVKVKNEIHTKQDDLLALRKGRLYHAELFWSHQMFLKTWIPEDRNVVDEL